MEDFFKDINKSDLLVLVISSISLFVSVIVLLITYKTYILKYGYKVRGWVGISSSITSTNSYFHTLVLENLKDKDLVIFDIFVRFGHNIYLDMLDKDDLNESYFHIIPALSTKEFRFGPAIEYTSGTDLVNLSQLFANDKISRQIILSTNQGKVLVGPFKKGWSPISDYFSNYGTVVINPIRYYSDNSIYGRRGREKEQTNPAIDYGTYGNQTLYLVTLKRKHFGLITYPIWKDAKVQYFSNIDFTEESLENKDSLKKFLLKAKSNNKIDFEAIDTIVDFQSYVNSVRKKYSTSPILLEAENWYTYHVIDKVQTYGYKLKEYYKRKWQKKEK
jgi:hypothetical protein|nr:hypothetical protein [uncultured Macellibacteroides sp.]